MSNPTGLVLKNALVLIGTSSGAPWTTSGANSMDASAANRRVRITNTADLLDDTHMGQNSHSRIVGLINWSMEMEFLQQFASTGTWPIAKTLGAIYAGGQPVYIETRFLNAARSSDNPGYAGMVVMETYNPIDGNVGGLLTVTAAFRSAGDLSYLTSSSS